MVQAMLEHGLILWMPGGFVASQEHNTWSGNEEPLHSRKMACLGEGVNRTFGEFCVAGNRPNIVTQMDASCNKELTVDG